MERGAKALSRQRLPAAGVLPGVVRIDAQTGGRRQGEVRVGRSRLGPLAAVDRLGRRHREAQPALPPGSEGRGEGERSGALLPRGPARRARPLLPRLAQLRVQGGLRAQAELEAVRGLGLGPSILLVRSIVRAAGVVAGGEREGGREPPGRGQVRVMAPPVTAVDIRRLVQG